MKDHEHPRFEIPIDLKRKMVEAAKQFRKEPTPSEAILWRILKDRKLNGVKFRRQQPIGPFVVDFFAPAYRLVVEIDGPIHINQQEADRERQKLLELIGLKVVRIHAEVVEQQIQSALMIIRSALLENESIQKRNQGDSYPSPLVGEG